MQGSFESSFKRYVKGEAFQGTPSTTWSAVGWQGERLYKQIILWSAADVMDITYEFSNRVDTEEGLPRPILTLRSLGYATGDTSATGCSEQPDHRGFVEITDPIVEQLPVTLGSADPVKLWVMIDVPADLKEGFYSSTVKVFSKKQQVIQFNIELQVVPYRLPQVSDWSFHLDLWQFPAEGLRLYNATHPEAPIETWSSKHFAMIRPFYKLLAEHGQKVVTAHIKDGALGMPSMIKWIKDAAGTWSYDFSHFDDYVELLFSLGINKQINCFSPVGWKRNITYHEKETGEKKEIEAPIDASIYQIRWHHFLTAFKTHLEKKGWFSKVYLYLDEIPEEEVKKVIQVIKDHHREWKIALAQAHSFSEETNQQIDDISGILGINISQENRQDKITTFYTSCTQKHPNSYVTPVNSPAEMTWMGWHARRENFNGYLRWAYDYWRDPDLRAMNIGSHTAGDFAIIYRSSNAQDMVPLSSLRLELLRDGIEDYEKIRILKARLESSTDPDDSKRLAVLNKNLLNFHAESGEEARSLVEKGQEVLQKLVTGELLRCSALGNSTGTTYISDFSTANSYAQENINYTADAYPAGGYYLHDQEAMEMFMGQEFQATFQAHGVKDSAKISVWTDWDDNGTFEEEELIFSGYLNAGTGASGSFPIRISGGVLPGEKRMRIRLFYGGQDQFPACGQVDSSSTLDVVINLKDPYCSTSSEYNRHYLLKKLVTGSCRGTNINFSSTNVPESGYLYHTKTHVETHSNGYVPIAIEMPDIGKCARLGIWVDWNDDKDFDDENEQIYSLGSEKSCTNLIKYDLSIVVPGGTTTGRKRMRIQIKDSWQDVVAPCDKDAAAAAAYDFDILIRDDHPEECSPELISPHPNSVLPSGDVVFRWVSNGYSVTSYRLVIFSEENAEKTYHTNEILSEDSLVVTGLPQDGRQLTAHLEFMSEDGIWTTLKYRYTTADTGPYCSVRGGTYQDYFITQLGIEGEEPIYRATKFPQQGFLFYPDRYISVDKDPTLQIKLSAASRCARLGVWIDWNKNNSFEEDEQVLLSGNATQCDNPTDITLPLSVQNRPVGEYRVRTRIQDAWHQSFTPCGEQNHSAAADFTLKINDPEARIRDSIQNDLETSIQWRYSESGNLEISFKGAWQERQVYVSIIEVYRYEWKDLIKAPGQYKVELPMPLFSQNDQIYAIVIYWNDILYVLKVGVN